MKNLLSLFLFIIPLQVIHAQQDIKDLYRQLELSLAQRNIASQRKEARIDSIQNLITPDMSAQKLFEHYYTLYQEYLTYRSDSAFFYIDKAEEIASRTNILKQKHLCYISRATVLATTGYFSQALSQLQHIDRASIDSTLLADYYEAYEWVYSVWSEYTDDEYYRPTLPEKRDSLQ